jgi:hypothetical protein
MQIFTGILIVGLIIYFNLTTKKTLTKIDHGTIKLLNKTDLETKEMLNKMDCETKKMLAKIEHEIRNQKATQSMLDRLLKKELPQND